MDSDLSRVKDLRDAGSFISTLDRIITDTLTNDFWNITVPNDLETSSARSPSHFAYLAAQNRLGAPVLFSDKKIGDLLDPALRTQRKRWSGTICFRASGLSGMALPTSSD